MTNRGKMLLGIMGGLIAGTTVGLLVAPASGSNTRRGIAHSTSTWVNKFGQLFTRKNSKIIEEKNRTRQRKAAAQERVNKLKQGLG